MLLLLTQLALPARASERMVPVPVRLDIPLTARASWGQDGMVGGDFDGDGAADFAAGDQARGESTSDPDEHSSGAVFLWYDVLERRGTTTGDVRPVTDIHLPSILGEDDEFRFGRELSAGDYDGDGFDDLVVAAAPTDGSVLECERSVYPGGPGGLATARTVTLQQGPAAHYSRCLFGSHFDEDDDGFDDLVVLLSSEDSAAYGVHHGSPEGLGAEPSISVELDLTSPFGTVVADVNGDGFDDLVAFDWSIAVAFGPWEDGQTQDQLVDRNFYPPAVSGDLNGDGYVDLLSPGVEALAGSSGGLESDYAAVVEVGEWNAGSYGLLSVDVDDDGFDDAVAQAYPMYGETDEHAYVLWGGTDFLSDDRVTVNGSGGPWGCGLTALVTEDGVLGFAAASVASGDGVAPYAHWLAAYPIPLAEPSYGPEDVEPCRAEGGGCVQTPGRPQGRLGALALGLVLATRRLRVRTSGGENGIHA